VNERDVILIDLGSIFWAAWHSTAAKEISEAHDRSLAQIRQLSAGYPLAAVCCDSASNFRKSIDPSYKANRPPRDSAAYAELDRTKRALFAEGFLLWEVEGLEADDVLATACRAAVKLGHDVTIASSDKDLAHCVQHGVQWLSPKTGECLDRVGVFRKFGVYPEQMRDFLALMGDASDNIRGVAGVGKVGAAKLLKDWVTIEQLMAAVVHTPQKVATPAVSAALRDALAWLPTTIRLVSLRYDAPIKFDQIYQQRESVTQRIAPMNDTTADPDRHDEPAPEVEAEPDPVPMPEPEPRLATVRTLPTAQASNQQIEIAATASLVAPPSWDLGLEPTSLGAAYKLATGLYVSKLYSRFPSAEAIWAVIIRGRELGLGALTALDCFHIVEGKPTPSAHFLISRAKLHPDCEYLEFVEGDAKRAVWKGKSRQGKEIVLEYTIEDARKAGLVKAGSNWEKRAPEMLRKTCGVQLSRIIVPGALLGSYSVEELGAA